METASKAPQPPPAPQQQTFERYNVEDFTPQNFHHHHHHHQLAYQSIQPSKSKILKLQPKTDVQILSNIPPLTNALQMPANLQVLHPTNAGFMWLGPNSNPSHPINQLSIQPNPALSSTMPNHSVQILQNMSHMQNLDNN